MPSAVSRRGSPSRWASLPTAASAAAPVERHLLGQQARGAEAAEHHMGVGDRGLGAALAVGGGPGPCAGAGRADAEGPRCIDPGDRAAAGADGVDVDHRHEYGKAGDPGVAGDGLGKAAVGHDADVGAGPADIEGDDVAAPGEGTGPGATQHARGRAGKERQDRPLGHHRGRGDAAVGAHDVEIGGESGLAEHPFESAHIAGHLGADEGVHGSRGEALELAELRRHRRRGRHERVGKLLPQDGLGPLLVRGVEVAEEKADGDGPDARLAQRPRRDAHALLIQGHQHLAPRRH